MPYINRMGIRHAVRSLVFDRGVSAVVIACLALGIGVNATLFSVIDGVLIQPLPYAEPHRLFILNETFERGGGPRQLSFESPQLAIELEVTETGPRERRVAGQLLPPEEATVLLERPGVDPVSVQADDLGRFVLEGLLAGVVRLRVGAIAIPWTAI